MDQAVIIFQIVILVMDDSYLSCQPKKGKF